MACRSSPTLGWRITLVRENEGRQVGEAGEWERFSHLLRHCVASALPMLFHGISPLVLWAMGNLTPVLQGKNLNLREIRRST